MNICRRKVLFFGHVQGVGFRDTVFSVAKHFNVTGHVRNLPNGSVELVAEGSPGEIRRFLEAIRNRMAGFIDREEISESPSTGESIGFEIR